MVASPMLIGLDNSDVACDPLTAGHIEEHMMLLATDVHPPHSPISYAFLLPLCSLSHWLCRCVTLLPFRPFSAPRLALAVSRSCRRNSRAGSPLFFLACGPCRELRFASSS
ncbi:unnamed protein product [Arctogadus glacialis]